MPEFASHPLEPYSIHFPIYTQTIPAVKKGLEGFDVPDSGS